MKKIIIFSLVLGMTLLAGGVVVAAGAEKAGDESSRYLVKSNNGILKMVFGVNHKFDSGFTTELSKGQLKFLGRLGVETEEVGIYQISAPPGACSPWPECKNEEPEPEERSCYLETQVPYGITKVNGGSGGAGVIVAVLDTGVNQDHPDLIGNIIDCVAFGYRTCEDGNGHGTHVAGTILADGGISEEGIFGVAPEAKLIAVKVLDEEGRGYTDDIAMGIRYAVKSGANIISMSLGGPTQSDLIKDAINYAIVKGVLVVASAGNSGPEEDTIGYPAANVNVVAVGAIDVNEDVPRWSSRGINDGDYVVEEREIEFAAPGVFVESTYKDGCYTSMSGTSMATPHVAGLAAKLWDIDAATTRINLQTLARAHNLYTPGDDSATGFGLPIAP